MTVVGEEALLAVVDRTPGAGIVTLSGSLFLRPTEMTKLLI
jgi:hypothetical protein